MLGRISWRWFGAHGFAAPALAAAVGSIAQDGQGIRDNSRADRLLISRFGAGAVSAVIGRFSANNFRNEMRSRRPASAVSGNGGRLVGRSGRGRSKLRKLISNMGRERIAGKCHDTPLTQPPFSTADYERRWRRIRQAIEAIFVGCSPEERASLSSVL